MAGEQDKRVKEIIRMMHYREEIDIGIAFYEAVKRYCAFFRVLKRKHKDTGRGIKYPPPYLCL